ncbi:hypothetical protein EXIGLDRAFT_691271 [Exidia glandulosa HHB12029]|uniref:Uncharacterized protein n=1 Tax=Exidia glandulosa HHB12029 TaxID=1314781 RepID=A0A166MUW8_EXIGL|nr:hypothetical protein EXIGLDRAFT_691271 [Exidia glandulosa HHB12029]
MPPTQLPKPAVLLFGRRLPAPRVPPASKDPVASCASFKVTVAPRALVKTPTHKTAARVLFAADLDIKYEQDRDEGDNIDDNETAPMQISPTQGHTRISSQSGDPLWSRDAFYILPDVARNALCQLARRTRMNYEEVASPARKKVATAFDHIVPGYEGDERLSMVPDCMHEIVEGSFKVYLPLHLFNLDVLRQEEDARVGLRPGESVTTCLPPPKIPKSELSFQLWMQWMKRMLACLEVLCVLAFVIKIFSSHFDHIMLADDFVTAWQVWLLYDMCCRQLFKGERPHDIA